MEQLLIAEAKQGTKQKSFSLENPDRYSLSEQMDFLPYVLDRIVQAKKQRDHYTSLIDSHNQNRTANREENSNNQYSHETNIKFRERERRLIRALGHAELRITSYQTFGTCRLTGQKIEEYRLEKTPHITLSLKGKEIERINKNKKNINK